MADIKVPANFEPRWYQLDALRALDSGIKRHFWRWHRRCGKDKLGMAVIAKEMFRRVGSYYYVFPTYTQGKKIIWEGADGDGFKFLDHIPPELVKRKNNQELLLETVNGSVFRIVGSDDIDTLRGTNPVGLIFSEYADQSKEVWEVLEPILTENNGWAIFNSTPKGQNHMYQLDIKIRHSPEWFYSELQTLWKDRPNYTGLVTAEKFQQLRDEGREEWWLEQEYGVSYSAATQGAIYFDQIEKAEATDRIGDFPPDPTNWVDTFWDLGVNDSTVIWFRQIRNGKLIFVDYYENHGKDFSFYVEILRNKGYRYKTHFLPHDGGNRNIMTSLLPSEVLAELCDQAGVSSDVIVCPKFAKKQDGIMAVRRRFGRYFFNYGLCLDGLEKLKLYHRRYDPKRQQFLAEPIHDWTSHCADALMTEAASEEMDPSEFYGRHGRQIKVNTTYDIFK